jgi:Phage tail protein (Tail_P2_I)
MSQTIVPLFERLPEIYRTRDAEQIPANPLRAYLSAVERAFGAVHADIAQLYENLFIETCDDWVIPYIADLLGTSHLKGNPRTLRADVADTIALRRRKGTLSAIERLAFDLTGWACRSVELRENLAWAQHLNHQRPDVVGVPAHEAPPRGGTVPIRDPRSLALLGTAFDPFAYLADTRPARNAAGNDVRHVNLPNLAIFLWRLSAYRLQLTRPLFKGITDLGAQTQGLARFALRFDLHPLDLPVRLFNTSRAGVSQLTRADAVPGQMLVARLTTSAHDSSPADYVAIDYFDDTAPAPGDFDLGEAGLHLFFPASLQPGEWQWTFRGDNLCAWETGLRQPVRSGEVVIDPDIGRIVIGLDTEAQRDKLVTSIDGADAAAWYASFTYAAPGPVGAHPVARDRSVDEGDVKLIFVDSRNGDTSLQEALNGLDAAEQDWVIEIRDSFVHRLDLQWLPHTFIDGHYALRLSKSLTIRAAANHRPIVLLAKPLAFRPLDVRAGSTNMPSVRLEGLYFAPDAQTFPAEQALITRAALTALEIVGCTFAPGGHALRDGSRAPSQRAFEFHNGYGFTDTDEEQAFAVTPHIVLQSSVCGAIAIDDRYRLTIASSIVDAVPGAGGVAGDIAIGPASTDANAWSAPLDFDGLTCFGAVRTQVASGSGGLFTRRFEALDNQHGCIKSSWFGGSGNRLPPNSFCLHAPDARLVLTSERHNDPGYAQVSQTSDARIRTLGPDDDTMGAFGFQLEAHKWTNLQVRLREFMPVGVRPLIVPVT